MSKQINLPSNQALIDAMQCAKNSPEAVEYLKMQVCKLIPESESDLRTQVDLFVEQVITMQSKESSSSWRGEETPSTLFTNFHDKIAKAAAEALAQATNDVELADEGVAAQHELNFAIDDDGNFVRGWS